ncbi:MAG: DUF5020 domain-containing protein [Flavobacteriia bacterium]|nr:MAG: DUF5020 domain-containing protein [Flavobacteriia bacterium]
MKTKLLLLFLLSFGIKSFSQNIQLHYDFGKDRKYVTTTVEMFKPDKYGNTFFFIDMDYNSGGTKGISLVYWEIARVLKTEKMPFGIHVEFDGGFGRFNTPEGDVGYRINESYLAGVDYSIHSSDFSKGASFKVLYKTIIGKNKASFQLTTVWYANFFDNKLTLSGFADFWKEDLDFNFDGDVDAEYVFLTEPQIWYNFNKHFSVGSEVEFSNNFGNIEGFYVRPTIAVKATF